MSIEKTPGVYNVCGLLSQILSALGVLMVMCLLCINGIREVFYARGPLQEAKTIIIDKNDSVYKISNKLAYSNIIIDAKIFGRNAFVTAKTIFARSATLRAGEWQFLPGASMAEVIQHLAHGQPVIRKITFPEGWTSAQIAARINSEQALVGESIATPPEGTLFPGTYNFFYGDTKKRIMQQLTDDALTALKQAWGTRVPNLPLENQQQLLILASIIEKESSNNSELSRIAGVFVNRLHKGMRLQTDPTVVYNIYRGASWEGPRILSKKDLELPGPYNTYKIQGLPPGPICNPGRAALDAAARPMQTLDLYFVADGSGGHTFATNYANHLKNVAAFRKLRQKLD